MIQFVTGLPGSGKSYFGLFNLGINFAKTLHNNKKFKPYKDKNTKYTAGLTNINEINFDEFDNVYPFNYNKFYEHLQKLHTDYKSGKTDSELQESSKDVHFFNTLIVLDEVHNYLNKDNEILVWWLSYHRHFNQDIILITQDIPLIDKKYKSFTEFYYKALPSSRKILNLNMVYVRYSGHQLFQTQKIDTLKYPIIPDIFNLYGSGENNKQKSFILKYILISLFIFILVGLGLYLFISSLTSDKEQETKEPVNQIIDNNSYINEDNTKTININNKQFYKINCNKNYCFINNLFYEKYSLLNILDNAYTTIYLNNNQNEIYLLTDDILKLFERIENNDKDSSMSVIPNFNN